MGIYKYFLDTEIDDNDSARSLLQKLMALDNFGIFVSIFLEEIDNLGAALYSRGDSSDKTDHIVRFLDFLVEIAGRGFDEYVPLSHVSEDIRVGIILLAKSRKAATEGVLPYKERVENTSKFADSVYVVSYRSAQDFLPRVLRALTTANNVSVVKNVVLPSVGLNNQSSTITVIMLQRNHAADTVSFDDKVNQSGIAKGSKVEGKIIDVSPFKAIVQVGQLEGIILSSECSWEMYRRCPDCLDNGVDYQFLVKSINYGKCRLELTRKFPENDPWLHKSVPSVGDTIRVTVLSREGDCYVALYQDAIQVIIPNKELSWTDIERSDVDDVIGTSCRVVVYDKSLADRILLASLTRLNADFWRDVSLKMTKGTRLTGKVTSTGPNGVRILLPNGLAGEIPKDAMMRGGFEYAAYQDSLVSGQSLQVVVMRVNVGKHLILLDLARNYVQSSRPRG